MRKLVDLFKQTQRIQVLRSPAGVPYGEIHPETREWLQGVPMQEKADRESKAQVSPVRA